MPGLINRRAALVGAAVSFSRIARASNERSLDAEARLAVLDARHGGRLGVAILDMESHVRVEHRGDEKFPLCSTFKFLAAAAVLARVDAEHERLDRFMAYDESALDTYAPITKAHVQDGGMKLADICAAAMIWSDNTAGNLMLQVLGGPEGLTRQLRDWGDGVTRLDRTEPTLNTALPGDERDTTTPRAMLETMRSIFLGKLLSQASRDTLENWMVAAQTGQKRIRAGVPASWRVGDKTGSGENATANTIAVIYPPGRAPLLTAVYYTLSGGSEGDRNGVHADIGRLITELV